MTLKSILALSLDSNTNEATLKCAATVVRRFGAHITVTHIKGLAQVTAPSGFEMHSGLLGEALLREIEAT